LLDRIQEEAQQQEFPVDAALYRSSQKEPTRPILCAGALDAPICVVGRDLGRDEVRLGQPLVGAGGSLVRRGILEAWGRHDLARGGKAELESALDYVLLTNTVPYKPPGNKAYSDAVKERFRPFLSELLTELWAGTHVITLGTEAFHWFEPYGDREAFETIGRSDDRFGASFACRLPRGPGQSTRPGEKLCQVLPLPHPSPLNRRWSSQFPGMLAARLRQIRRATGLEDV
jgi:uracil-DNA glycosylase family 4